MISNYLKLRILLTGDRTKEPFWKDLRHYRNSLDMPPEGFRDEDHFAQWNSKWSAEDVFKKIPRSVAIAWNISAVLVPRADFTVLNLIAELLIHKYRLDPTYSSIKKMVEILKYGNVEVETSQVDQPVDFRYEGNLIHTEMHLMFNKHTRPENFLNYYSANRKVIRYFQGSLPKQKFPTFIAKLSPKRQTVNVQIFKNTTPSQIKKNWHEIKLLQKKLDGYSSRTKDPNPQMLLAIADQKSTWKLPNRGDKSVRRSLKDTLKILSKIAGKPVSKNYYKKCKRIVNRIKKPA